MVNINEGQKDIVIRIGEIRQDVQRLINSKVNYWQIDFLHENITVQKTVQYLTQLEREKDSAGCWTDEERRREANDTLKEADEALSRCID